LADILKTFHGRKTTYRASSLRKFMGKEVGLFIEERSARTLRGAI
jgi:hypothetical protein